MSNIDTEQVGDAVGSPLEPTVRPRPSLFLCRRTSTCGGKPCDEAFEVVLVNTDTRSCDDPKKILAHHGTDGDWYERGTNHRVEAGMIRRDLGTKTKWAVELPDVMPFVKKYGDCVVGVNDDGFNEIEIYDDYRE